jgi:hypothetical protein
MPRGDRTGPMGAGPMTGRGAGICTGAGAPGFAGGGRGRGMGLGCGAGRSLGRGFGFGRGADWAAPATAPDQELAVLKQQAGAIQARIQALEGGSAES